jgi:hypothetical protein
VGQASAVVFDSLIEFGIFINTILKSDLFFLLKSCETGVFSYRSDCRKYDYGKEYEIRMLNKTLRDGGYC